LDLQLPVHITTKVVSSTLVHDEMYPIQHYVMKFSGFVRVLGFPPPKIKYCWKWCYTP